MSELASPRNLLLAHTLSVLSGMLARWLVLSVIAGGAEGGPLATSWPHVGAIAAAMALSSVLMICLRCPHPPAAATATIAAMGFFADVLALLGLVAALILVVVEAHLFIRVLGGLPYPFWRSDPRVAAQFGPLAGIPDASTTSWQRLSAQLFRRR
jgi:CBS-domain-containing membrane protein